MSKRRVVADPQTIPWKSMARAPKVHKCTHRECGLGRHLCKCDSNTYDDCMCAQCSVCKDLTPHGIHGECLECTSRFEGAVSGLVAAWKRQSVSGYSRQLCALGELMESVAGRSR